MIHPGASRIEKAWPAEKFSGLIEKLQGEYGARIVLVGAAGEAALGEIIARPLKEKPLIAIGKTTLGRLTALISMADLFIGNESGPMHIAASLSIPTAAIMSGVPSLYGPYKTRSRVVQKKLPCWHPWMEHCWCPGNRYQCLKEIEVEDVWKELNGDSGLFLPITTGV
jgi:ADP-heptose:LPS heptosyltransferase